MSEFDKRVCEWVSSSRINRGSKQNILHNVKNSIDGYKKVSEMSSTRADVDKKKGQENINLLPRPQTTAGRHDDQIVMRTSLKGGHEANQFQTKLNKSAGRSPVLKKKNSLQRSSISTIDFEFSSEVDKELSRLELEEQKEQLPPLHPSTHSRTMSDRNDECLSTPHSSTRAYFSRDMLLKGGSEATADKPSNPVGEPEGNGASLKSTNNNEINEGDVLSDHDQTAIMSQTHFEMEDQRRIFEIYTLGNPLSADGNGNDGARDSSISSDDADGTSDDIIEDDEDRRRRVMSMKRASRPGISCTSLGTADVMAAEFEPSPKAENKLIFIAETLSSHYLFSFLDDAQIQKLAEVMKTAHLRRDSKVIVRGESNSVFYIILSGEATMTINDVEGNEKTINLTRGAAFGEVALLYPASNEMDVAAETDMECATLDRMTYKMFVSHAAEEKRQRYASFLERVPFLEALTSQERLKVAEALKEDAYTKGDKIIKHGEKGNWLHIIVEGAADVIGRDANDEEVYVATFHVGECAGDLEFLYHHETVADIVAKSPVVRTAKLSRVHFERLIGTAKELLERKAREDESYHYYRTRMQSASPPREDLEPPFDAPPEYATKTEWQEDI